MLAIRRGENVNKTLVSNALRNRRRGEYLARRSISPPRPRKLRIQTQFYRVDITVPQADGDETNGSRVSLARARRDRVRLANPLSSGIILSRTIAVFVTVKSSRRGYGVSATRSLYYYVK